MMGSFKGSFKGSLWGLGYKVPYILLLCGFPKSIKGPGHRGPKDPIPRAPSIQIVPTLGSIVSKYYLLRAFWSPRE